jgi:hypothetical protein
MATPTPEQTVPLVVKAFYEEAEDEKVLSVDMATFQTSPESWQVEFVGQQGDGEQVRLLFTWDAGEQKGFYQAVAGGQAEPVDTAGNPMTEESGSAAMPANFSEIEKQLAALEAQNQALQSRLAAEEKRARVASVTNFCEQHRSRLTFDPTSADALDFAEGEATSLVDFMAAQDDKGLAFMQSFIKALPAQVPTGEVATDFSEPAPAANFTEAIAEARAKLNAAYKARLNGGAN